VELLDALDSTVYFCSWFNVDYEAAISDKIVTVQLLTVDIRQIVR